MSFEEIKEAKRARDYKKAEQLINSALEREPDSRFYRSQLADVYVRQGRLTEAEVLVDEVLQEDPSFVWALSVKGAIAARQRRYEEAYQVYHTAYALKPDAFLASRQVEVRLRQKRYAEAARLAEDFLRNYRDDWWLQEQLARAYRALGKRQEALELYQKLQERKPHDENIQAVVLQLKSEITSGDKAADELGRVVKLSKYRDNIQLLTRTANEYYERQDYEKAKELYEQVLARNPEHSFARQRLGYCHYHLGDNERAAELLKQVLEADPFNYQANSTLRKIYIDSGRPLELIPFYENLLARYPKFKQAYGHIKKLQQAALPGEKPGQTLGR